MKEILKKSFVLNRRVPENYTPVDQHHFGPRIPLQ
jgi:hypothetical protein